jgi:hypothetical protein
MTSMRAWMVTAVLLSAGCGAEPGVAGGTDPGLGLAAETGATDVAAAFAGTYTGALSISRGRGSSTFHVSVAVAASSPGLVRVPLRDISPPPEDHLEFPPPRALAIVLTRVGDWPYRLESGERYRLDSVNLVFADDGSSLEVTTHATLEGGDPMTWSFTGRR